MNEDDALHIYKKVAVEAAAYVCEGQSHYAVMLLDALITRLEIDVAYGERSWTRDLMGDVFVNQ